jgi:hypothetical protein
VEGSGYGLILKYYPSICLEGLRKITITSFRIASQWGQDYFHIYKITFTYTRRLEALVQYLRRSFGAENVDNFYSDFTVSK